MRKVRRTVNGRAGQELRVPESQYLFGLKKKIIKAKIKVYNNEVALTFLRQ